MPHYEHIAVFMVHNASEHGSSFIELYINSTNWELTYKSHTKTTDDEFRTLVYQLHSIPQKTLTCLFFTALHVMQTRYCDENSVRPSICPSVTRVYCDKTVERSVQIYIPYERIFSLVFWEEEWLVGGDPFYLKFWVNRPPLERNRRFSTNNRS